ncbi:hypothetical protein [Isoptericola dokdonensis]|uniref:Uncharacterized protein n=1 Tax=Isoptericola dokdonensis DS-3 TaxID=1300344 RepID=A0A161IGV5_9MICO|nr:hypothetical protein [Isoptericola dokdonensis]ANC32847.1 hypothetical protein I598_3338 [Isoptericola dokdonensis DS-3]
MSALVESPLQLLCVVEAHAAGLTGPSLRVVARADVPSMGAAVDAVRAVGLPDGLQVEVGSARAALTGTDVRVVGDPFSGVFQSSLVRGSGVDRFVVVDDGLATVDVARRLLAGEPMVRLAAPGGPLRSALGAVATRRLQRAARQGRLTLCTMLPADAVRADALRAIGVEVREHSFEWLASRPDAGGAGHGIDEPTVVVGSGLVGDRLVHADAYAAWLRGLAADGPVRYLPHRRHDPLVTALFEQLPGVRVDAPGAPVELRLRDLPAGRRVVSLPSTSAITLSRLLGPRGVEVVAQQVPEAWWTSRATPRLRAHLGLAADLATAASGRDRARRVA